ncbi:MAG: glycosyltransferase [Acidimicrobiales bacterium]
MINAVGARIGGAARHLPAFLRTFRSVEPDWELHVAVSVGEQRLVEGIELESIFQVALGPLHGRPVWDVSGICAHATAVGADCILNLTNHGPLRRCLPSIVYQRNPIYFDPGWVASLPWKARQEAAGRRLLAFWQMAQADAVVTPSHAMAGFLAAWRLSPEKPEHVVIPHAVDSGRFVYQPRPLRSIDDLHLAVISHAAPHKGIDTAIALAGDLVKNGSACTLSLTIPREGHTGIFREYVDRCIALARRLGIEDRVLFRGATDDVEALYSSADAIVVPSLTESFGFPLVEAMASGTPILASDIPSSLEVAGDSAWFYRAGDHRSAMEALATMAGTRPEEAQQKLDSGRRRAEELSWEHNARGVAALVRRCAS